MTTLVNVALIKRSEHARQWAAAVFAGVCLWLHAGLPVNTDWLPRSIHRRRRLHGEIARRPNACGGDVLTDVWFLAICCNRRTSRFLHLAASGWSLMQVAIFTHKNCSGNNAKVSSSCKWQKVHIFSLKMYWKSFGSQARSTAKRFLYILKLIILCVLFASCTVVHLYFSLGWDGKPLRAIPGPRSEI